MGIKVPLPKKGAEPPIFGPCLLWPNGWNRWMDQYATWCGGSSRPRRRCARWGPSSPSLGKGAQPPPQGAQPPPRFSAHVCCNQTAGWIKMPLGTKVGLGPGYIVLHGDPAPPQKLAHSPIIFGPCPLSPNGRPSQLLLSICFETVVASKMMKRH